MPKRVYYLHPCPLAPVLRQLPNIYQVTPIDREETRPAWELPAVVIADAELDALERIEKIGPEEDGWRLIYLLKGNSTPWLKSSDRVFALLPHDVPRVVIEKAVERAFESLRSFEERKHTLRELHRVATDLQTLNQIGIALSTERKTDALLELILTKSREITGCDAGCLYLVEEKPDGTRHLLFELSQRGGQGAPLRRDPLPIDRESMAGYAARTGEILNIQDAYRIRNLPFRLNRDFDREFNYRTKSMLVVPMKNQKGEVMGVLELINAKRHASVKLVDDAVVEEEVVPFSKRSQELAASLASQAAVALENNVLYRDIQRLFEGFVKAAITAIEARDPSTRGHSERVAKLTLGLAEQVDRAGRGPYQRVRFTPQDLQELRYAALLHDFGKVGVREDVLVKAKKLYPQKPSLHLIRERFLRARQALENVSLEKKLRCVLRGANGAYLEEFARIEAERDRGLKRLDGFLQAIVAANEPSRLSAEAASQLAEIGRATGSKGFETAGSLLMPDELRLLSIPRGTLDDDEREEIESHVDHSTRFLSQIPWTKELKKIPGIVRAHHWKLDGSGYPRRREGEEFPIQAKMMVIADIFDALTASDRPYKRAVPVERALDIIGQEARSSLLDPALFQLFVEAKVYRLTTGER